MMKDHKTVKKTTKSNKNLKKKSRKHSKNQYDTIIVGAGISGLNTAYQIIKKHPKHKILILEASDRIGGRLNTINYKGTQYEAGGARFNNQHKRLMKLLSVFNLDSNKIPIPSDIYFKPFPKDFVDKYDYITEFVNDKGIIDIHPLIKELSLLKQNGKISYRELLNHSLLDLIDKKLNTKYPNIKHVFECVFEYWSEIAVLNSYEALQVFKNDFNTKMQFYILRGGLSSLIQSFDNYLKKNNVDIKKNCYLDSIIRNNNGIYDLKVLKNYQDKKEYSCNNLVLAIQQKDLLKLNYLSRHQNILKLLNTVSHQPLYRIYAKYPVINGRVWFQEVPKVCTNLHIKFIIPYDTKKGLIMISYTDGKLAKYWNDQLSKGEDILLNKLNQDLRKLFPDIKIPNPVWIKHHYWSSGAAYWKTGSESNKIIPQIIEPIKNEPLYICGENFSNHQAWMEGALQTSEMVVTNITKNIKPNISSLSNKVSKKSQKGGKISKSKIVKKSNKSKNKQSKKISKYTMKQVEKHNKKSDAWLVINKKVYDVTKWINKHPGGNIIMKGVGKDATSLFINVGHSSNAKKILKGLQIGILI